MPNGKRWDELHVGVEEDGTVESAIVQTYLGLPYPLLCPDQYVYAMDAENKFVSFTMDNGETDIEVRLPFEVIDLFTKMVADAGKGK